MTLDEQVRAIVAREIKAQARELVREELAELLKTGKVILREDLEFADLDRELGLAPAPLRKAG